MMETKNKGGRPLKYTQEEFSKLVSTFWELCEEQELQPTKEQLVVHLDISRDTYNAWKKDGHQFSDTLKEIEARIEAHIVNKLLTENNPVGKIFYLKNAFGWRDRNETDITSGGEQLKTINVIKSDNSHDNTDS